MTHHLARRACSAHDGDEDDNHDGDGDTKKQSEKNTVTAQQDFDRRFGQPTPSPLKRAALVAFVVLTFWLAYNMRKSLYLAKQQQDVVYATRYSKEFKFRPAASPVVTERLDDGRVRIRGAQPAL